MYLIRAYCELHIGHKNPNEWWQLTTNQTEFSLVTFAFLVDKKSQGIATTRDGTQHASFIYHDHGVLGQFVALFEWLNTVVATFSILLFNSISRSQRLSLQVEQMNVELWTTSRCWSNILMLGGLLTSCPVTCVFLRLIVSLKYLQGELKGFMCCCSLSAECVVTAASSAQGKLRKCFSRILVLAFNLARLKNLP